jgi:4-hydroxybenzoate polyprenyltransferase
MGSGTSEISVSGIELPFLKRIGAVLADIKIAHTIFALPFALLSAHLAFIYIGGYRISTLLLILLCMVTARTAAMSFNRYLDRDIDIKNPRTRNRSIPGGRAKPSDALYVVIICCVIFVFACWILGPLPFWLSFVTIAFLLSYSAMKRLTILTHLWLGLALAISPTGAWIAITGQWSWIPTILSLSVMCWVAGFDIIYSLQDIEFDRDHRVFSIPAKFGIVNSLRITRFLHLVSWLALLWFGMVAGIGIPWWIAVGLVGTLLVAEHAMVRPDDLSRVGIAFFTVNGVISILLYISTLASSFLGLLNFPGGGPS